MAVWTVVVSALLKVVSVLLFCSAGFLLILAVTRRAMDLYVHDHYFVVLRIHFLLLSAVLFILTILIWKTKGLY